MDSPPSIPLRAGQTLGRYELLAAVAKGGMGQVWAGRLRGARGFQKLVAIKTLLTARAEDERFERMLFEEARIASLIQHSNVVQTLELGEHEGALYLVMEWVDGDPLSYLLNVRKPTGGIPLLIAVHLIAQTLRGLHAAHELRDENGAMLGVVHRDVSPHNIIVSYSGVAKLLDFGVAKAMNEQGSETSTGEIKGKFAYMAPEQILGAEVDQRADLFAVGIMLYLLTTGRHPFKNHDSVGVLHSISSEEPAFSPSRLQPDYSPALEAVVLKALEKQRDRRWSCAEEMRAALEAAMPEAFAPGADTRVREFISTTLGERAGHKREALRRAEAAVGGRVADSGSLATGQSGAQSASSMRAVSLDNHAEDQSASAPAAEAILTQAAPETSTLARRSGRTWAALVACGFLGLLASLAWRHQASGPASAGPDAAVVPWAPPAQARVAVAPVPPSSRAEPPVAVKADAAPLASSATPFASAARAAEVHHAEPVTKRVKATPAPRPAAPRDDTDDLIAPDYAR